MRIEEQNRGLATRHPSAIKAGIKNGVAGGEERAPPPAEPNRDADPYMSRNSDAVPRRWAVLAGKAAVTGAAALVAGEVLGFASFFLTQAMLSGRHRGRASELQPCDLR